MTFTMLYRRVGGFPNALVTTIRNYKFHPLFNVDPSFIFYDFIVTTIRNYKSLLTKYSTASKISREIGCTP